MRLKESREDAKIRKEKWNKVLDLMQQRFQEHLHKQQLIRDSLKQSRDVNYSKLKNDLREESKKWITESTMTSKITADLFTKPCTTGNKLYYDLFFSFSSYICLLTIRNFHKIRNDNKFKLLLEVPSVNY